jgi:tRNA G10  N-methylase Trm11
MRNEFRAQQVNLLTNCIVKSIDDTEFKWEMFFKLWFRQHGTPIFFLFKKNLSVTNTQYVELFSLIMRYCSKKISNNEDRKLLFYSTEHIRTSFTEVVISLLEDFTQDDQSKIISFSERYLDIFCSTIAVDMFFGSCAVFFPGGIEIDLEKIINDSGYVHSAGRSVYIRNIKKAKKNDFIKSIETHVNQDLSHDVIPFVVYSHEDFSAYDKESEDLIEKGIEHSKLYLEKMNMGSYRLSTIIDEMQNSPILKKRLLIPEPGNYLRQHSFRKGKTLWLITDRSISTGVIKNPGANRYYICYEQILKNDSPFYFFDENKPAWKSHTTMPHSLTAALINASRPIIENGVICDPFGGTGTTWLEVKRIQLKSKVICSDLCPATKLLLQDNLKFFTLSSNDLTILKIDLENCLINNSLEGQYRISFKDISALQEPYEYVLTLLNTLRLEQKDEEQEFYLSNSFVDELKKIPFHTRIMFYIGLRAELRFQGGYKRNSLTFDTAFKKSTQKLIEQINMLIELKGDVETKIITKEVFYGDSYIKSISRYSYRLTPKLNFSNYLDFIDIIDSEVISSLDARDLKENSNDLIICDPPYGFNTKEDDENLASLYTDFIDKAILSLKPKGQLIICLPAESFTGRDLSYCTRSDLVSRQIMIKAHQHNRLVYKPAQSIPSSSFTAPYYWESERALRRIILHFCFY